MEMGMVIVPPGGARAPGNATFYIRSEVKANRMLRWGEQNEGCMAQPQDRDRTVLPSFTS
jgi:hypothetical protein